MTIGSMPSSVFMVIPSHPGSSASRPWALQAHTLVGCKLQATDGCSPLCRWWPRSYPFALNPPFANWHCKTEMVSGVLSTLKSPYRKRARRNLSFVYPVREHVALSARLRPNRLNLVGTKPIIPHNLPSVIKPMKINSPISAQRFSLPTQVTYLDGCSFCP